MATFYTDGNGAFLADVKGGKAPEGFKALEPNTVDAAVEKHVPAVELQRDGHIVFARVGSTEHPMTEEHYIVYIEIDADGILMRKYLKPGDAPEACFKTDAKNIVAYEMCNKHGFWQSNQ